MVDNLLLVIGQVLTLFILMGIGFTLARMGKMTQAGIGDMSFVVLYVVVPCVVIDSFQAELAPGTGGSLAACCAIMCLFYVVHILISLLCYRGRPLDSQAPLRFSMVYANNGFMGLPLLRGVLGESAVIYGVITVVAFNLFQWTHGVAIMGGRPKLRQALVNPGTVGLAVGLCLFLTGARLPGVLNRAVGFVADLNTPLAMIVVGAQMSKANLKETFTKGFLYLSAGYKLVLAPLIALVVLLPLRGHPLLYCTCVIITAAPTAGVTGMLAQRFGRDTTVAAQTVTLSTLLSILTLPLFAAAAKLLSGI